MDREALDRVPTQELDRCLQAELRKEVSDGDLVRAILRELESRETAPAIEFSPEIQAAWDKFKADDAWRADKSMPAAGNWVRRASAMAASVVIIAAVSMGMLFTMPLEAKAETIWEKLFNFTDSVFQFFNFEEKNEIHAGYVFETDNPGLQKVYDAVVELGVTEPVVPMWLPEGYELEECKVLKTAKKAGICATFSNGATELVYKADIYTKEIWREYQKDDSEVIEFESRGIVHQIMKNNGKFVAIWTRENADFLLSAECAEEEIYKIILSVYTEGH